MRNLIERAFLAQHFTIFPDERRTYRDKCRNRVFVLDLANDHDPLQTIAEIVLQRVHGDDLRVRSSHILRSPVVPLTAMNDVPAQEVHGYDLRRWVLRLIGGPDHLPLTVLPNNV